MRIKCQKAFRIKLLTIIILTTFGMPTGLHNNMALFHFLLEKHNFLTIRLQQRFLKEGSHLKW